MDGGDVRGLPKPPLTDKAKGSSEDGCVRSKKQRVCRRKRSYVENSVKDAVIDMSISDAPPMRLDIKGHRAKVERLCRADHVSPTSAAEAYDAIMKNGFRDLVVVRDVPGKNVPGKNNKVKSAREELFIDYPEDAINLSHLENVVGPDVRIPTIDVDTQEAGPNMTISELKEYFSLDGKDIKRLLNVVSFNLDRTEIGEYVTPPMVVRDLDLVTRAWPKSDVPSPSTLTYLLLGPRGAYTDWHIDMGGSSVWYHVVSGCKVFLAAPKTRYNEDQFVAWSTSSSQTEFLGDTLRSCVRVKLYQGDTLFIPGGYLHAVSTPKDSVVLGGNFVHGLQFKTVHEVTQVEKQLKIQPAFRYPMHEKVILYAAIDLLKRLDRAKTLEQPLISSGLNQHELDGIPDLLCCLQQLQRRNTTRGSGPQALEYLEKVFDALSSEYEVLLCQQEVREEDVLGGATPEEEPPVAGWEKGRDKSSPCVSEHAVSGSNTTENDVLSQHDENLVHRWRSLEFETAHVEESGSFELTDMMESTVEVSIDGSNYHGEFLHVS